MIFKRVNLCVLSLLTIMIIGNSPFIIETSAFVYSNPSTTPRWTYSTGEQDISAVGISSNGRYISASSMGSLYLFNNSISNNKSPIWKNSGKNTASLAISENGSNLVAGGSWDEERIYFLDKSNPEPYYSHFTGDIVHDICISENGYVAAVSNGIIFLFSLNGPNPNFISRFIPKGEPYQVELSSDGTYMTILTDHRELYFYDTSDPSPKWYSQLSGEGLGLSMSADGNFIACGTDNVYLFNKSSPNPMWEYEIPYAVASIKISKDGRYIVAGGDSYGSKLYFFNHTEPTPEWEYSIESNFRSVAISDNGDYIAALDRNYWVYLFNKSSSEPIWRYRLDEYPTAFRDYCLDISSDGKYIVAGGKHYIYLFDRDNLKPPKLIISGYNIYFIFLIIGLISLGVGIFSLKGKKRLKEEKN